MQRVTVAICTWNRAALLDQTLAAMRAMEIPDGVEWELLVINNNCTDDTDEVIARHQAQLPLRRILEQRQGLSNARNRAVQEASGELILWTDDDVLVDPGWLAEYVAAADAWPEAVFFGGTIDPWFAVEPPRWIERNLHRLEAPLVIRQLGNDTRPIRSPDDLPYGANMAMRRAAFDTASFDPDLGVSGTAQLRGEETELMKALISQGYTGVWVGSARVRHYVRAERLTTRFVWRNFHGAGRTRVQLGHDRDAATVFGIPRYQIRQYLCSRLKSWLLSPWKNEAWIRSFADAAYRRGIISESYVNHRKNP